MANDLVQTVMLKLVEAQSSTKDIANVRAWLFQVTRNTIYDYYKNNKLNLTDTTFDNLEDSEFEDRALEQFLEPMILSLPEKYSKPLLLSDIDNLSQKEISEKLNLGLSAVKMRISRGREKLKEMFVECCDIDYDSQGNMCGCTVKHSCDTLNKIAQELEFD